MALEGYGTPQGVEGDDGQLNRFVVFLAFIVAMSAHGLLTVTMHAYVLDMKPGYAIESWIRVGSWIQLGAFYCCCGLLAVRRRYRGPQRTWPPSVLVVSYTAAMLVGTGVVTDEPAQWWAPPADWVAVIAGTVPVLAAAVVLLVLLSSLPGTADRTRERPDEPPDITAVQVQIPAVMPPPLEPTDEDGRSGFASRSSSMGWLATKQENYLVNHYMGLHVTIVSVALGIAGIRAALLLSERGLSTSAHVLLGLLWLAGLLATVAAFAGAVAGALVLPGQAPALWDLFIPLLIALVEFLLFVVLAPALVPSTTPGNPTTYWMFGLGAFGMVTTAAVVRVRVILRSASYPSSAKAHIDWYIRKLRGDQYGPIFVAVLGGGGGAAALILPNHEILIGYLVVAVSIPAFCIGIHRHGRTAHRWRTMARGHFGSREVAEEPSGR